MLFKVQMLHLLLYITILELDALPSPFKVFTETALQCGDEYHNVWHAYCSALVCIARAGVGFLVEYMTQIIHTQLMFP